MKGFLKNLLLSIFSIALVAGTLFVDFRIDAAQLENQLIDIEITEGSEGAVFSNTGDTYLIKSSASKNLTVVVRGNTVLRLSPASEMQFTFQGNEGSAPTFSIKLINGRFWINTLNSAVTSAINTVAVEMIAEPGIFDIQYGDSTVLAGAVRRSLRVELIGNKLVVPEGNIMTISERKIASSGETIAKLRYAKLIKEFPYKLVLQDDEWTKFNKTEDKVFLSNLQQTYVGDVKNRGPAIGGGVTSAPNKIRKVLSGAGQVLTFDRDLRSSKKAAHALGYLDAAVYSQIIGKRELADEWIREFAKEGANQKGSAVWKRKLFERLDRLAFAKPYSDLFEIYASVRDFESPSTLVAMHGSFNDVLDTSAMGSDTETKTRVLTTLRHFGSLADQSVGQLVNPSQTSDVLLEYVVINDFLKRNPKLLREEFLKVLELFERGHLNLIAEKEVADDVRQFFINEKLKTIRILKLIMETEGMPFQDARRSILLVAAHIEALQPPKSDTAVLSFFDDQVKDLAPLIAFLRSPQAERLHGSFTDEYTSFSSQQDEARKVNNLLNDADGGIRISAFRREELAQQVSSAFGPVGVKGMKIVLPDDENDPRVRITEAKLEGQAFTAVYDTAREVLSNIAIEGEAIPNAIRLENLRKFFLIRVGKLVLPGGASASSLIEQPSETPTQTILERVAKKTVLDELTELGIAVEDENIGLENLPDGIVHIRLATVGRGTDAKIFSFDITENAGMVSTLKVQTIAGEIPVNDTFAISELTSKVEQIFQKVVLDKEREEELKRFMEERELEGAELLEGLGNLAELSEIQ